jgi:hypothetical protein
VDREENSAFLPPRLEDRGRVEVLAGQNKSFPQNISVTLD